MTDHNITVVKVGDSKWIARFPFSYETKDLVKAAGFRFDGTNKVWWTDNPDVAVRVGSAKAIEALVTAQQAKAEAEAASLAGSRSADADIDVPVPAGLSLLGYQKAGVAYAIQRPATLFGDEMGLGKTIQAIATCNALPEVKNVLIVCPASLKLNWELEWRKWDVRGLPVRVVNSKDAFAQLPLELREREGPGFVGVVIINYERVKNHRNDIDMINWDVLICDEVHYMKSGKSQRKQYVLGKWEKDKATGEFRQPITPIAARTRLFLTGTPIVNKPIELWPIVQALDRNGLGRSRNYFEQRYCGLEYTAYARDVGGATNLDELQDRLRKAIMIRRLKKDVLKELPPKRRSVVLLEPDKRQQTLIAREREILHKLDPSDRLYRTDAGDNYDQIVATLKSPKGVSFEEIAQLRHDVAVSKIPAVIEHVEELLETVDKVVLMAHHHDVVDAVRLHFGSIMTATIDGRTPVEERQAAVTRFQNDPTCRLFVGSIRAAGVGLTLTAASTVVFAELDWTPGNVSQAEDRCHRIGQHDMVNVYHLVLDGSLDSRMARIIVAKQAIIDQALDIQRTNVVEFPGVSVGGGSSAPIENQGRPGDPALPGTGEGPTPNTGGSLSTISPERRSAVHQCLRILAGMCDGAHMKDECGFNAYDTNFGKDLAERQWLTDKQVLAAAKMVRKYKRQLPAELLAQTMEAKA